MCPTWGGERLGQSGSGNRLLGVVALLAFLGSVSTLDRLEGVAYVRTARRWLGRVDSASLAPAGQHAGDCGLEKVDEGVCVPDQKARNRECLWWVDGSSRSLRSSSLNPARKAPLIGS